MSDRIELYVNGSKVYDNQASGVPTPVPTPTPTPTPTPPTGGSYPGPNMWVPPNNRRESIVLNTASPISRGGFTVPAGFTGTIELEFSGSNINMRLNGNLTGGDTMQLEPGNYTFDAELTSGATSAEGSIAVVHHP